MPELPEVETVRRSLEPHAVGRRVRGVEVLRGSVIEGEASAEALLVGRVLRGVHRHGKLLMILAESGEAEGAASAKVGGRCLAIHLGMSGQVLVKTTRQELRSLSHVHVVWEVERVDEAGRGVESVWIGFRDPRRFGGVWTFDDEARLREAKLSVMGPDALVIEGGALFEALRRTSRAVKAALLDQRVLAGVGNIYADEALFRSRIDPRTKGRRLARERVEELAAMIRAVLAEAVDARGSTLRDYVDAEGAQGGFALRHAVYGRGGQACTVCGTTLKQITLAQRTTVFCPGCQKRV
ncbi:MAG: bifunctional DNA-formamidopyrimidine glycosylase/DNA-(apurinic or apyrimidinic site) lyase [Phycisphaerales bacterium]|nr:bifunctional DNA-formamidopyrimidine glycosylase/DNA-(apurinic or apyrimidinic site) lyase [Phycisphaerales bacterium]